MPILNALIVTTFLLLLVASAAVTGSMIVLALFDRLFGKKKVAPVQEPEPEEIISDPLSYDF
jgi:hypothetical protein